jgi:hypothetical protein
VSGTGDAPSRSAADRRGSGASVTRDLLLGSVNSRLDQGLRLRHKTPCSKNDPLTVMLVLDALLNVFPGEEFNAAQLTRTLEARYEYILWNGRIVSRILTDLYATLYEAMTDKMANRRGLPLSSDERQRWTPLHRVRQAEGWRYTINVTAEGWELMLRLREELQVLAARFVSNVEFEDYPLAPDIPSENCPVVTERHARM